MQPYAVSATSHWPNYLPEYIAAEHGYFADEGLDFAQWAPETWTDVLPDLDQGRAQAVLGGIWVPAMYHRRGREYRAFAQLNARNPKAIVTRRPTPDFHWSDLAGRTVLAPGAGSAAYYLHTAGLLRRAGVDPDGVDDLRASGLWADIRIDRSGYDEWQAMLAEGGLIEAPIPYDTLVDPRPADAAVAALTAPARSA